MNAIEIKGLVKEYPGFTLGPIDLTLPSGCILGLVGENGAGKSTTIRLMLDLIRKNAGSIEILGKEAGDANAPVKDDLGIVLDRVGFPVMLKPMQVGKIMQDAYSKWDMQLFESYINRFHIPADKRFRDMSNGMKMKLGLATALSHHAKLLILDEATNGLDPVARDEVNDILLDFTREEDHSVLISSHLVTDLEKICDYVAFLHQGKMMLCEEKDVLANEYGVIQCRKEDLAVFEPDAVLHSQVSPYGAQAILKKDRIPEGFEVSPVSIEELFVVMVKEA